MKNLLPLFPSQLMVLVLSLIIYHLSFSSASAQSRDQQLRTRVDSALTARYYKTPYDTNYVVRPEGSLTLKLRLNQSGDAFHVKDDNESFRAKADLSTRRKTTISIGASYRGISAALAINPAKLSGAYKDYEFSLSYYSSKLSLDASYHRATTLSGDVRHGDNMERLESGDVRHGDNMERLESGDVKLKMANLAGYYVFNHRRFSYPAAFTQSYIQRRSVGSWLAGISYQGGSISTRDELKERDPNAHDVYIHIGHFGIGGGYGYNWVPGKKWLLHLSVVPTVVIYSNNYMDINDERKESGHVRLNMIFNQRAAIVYNFSPRFFAGTSLVMHNSIFKDNLITVNQNKWRARAFVGMRL